MTTPIPPLPVPDHALDQIWRAGRSHNGWLDQPVTDAELHALYDLTKWGPTSVNCQPMRIVFIRSAAAKARLKPILAPSNADKSMAAPVVALLGYDLDFYQQLPAQFPHNQGVKGWFEGAEKSAHAETTAFRNATLQGGYFILAARALGLDCGPMSGFDNAKADAEFFAGTRIKSNFLCNLGHGDTAKLFPRSPRLTFAEACTLI
jgi:3-hydroxypropanoate dehydrogenase